MNIRSVAAAAVTFYVLCSGPALAFTTKANLDEFQARAVNVPGVDVVVRNAPSGTNVLRAQTDANSVVNLRGLAPGNYVIEIDGKSLVAAMDRLAPLPLENRSNGASVSIGGFLGGGSSRSGSGHEGAGRARGGSQAANGGGLGLGLNVPLGGSNDPDHGSTGYWVVANGLDMDAMRVSYETPYCRDTASQGMRIRFTLPEGAGPVVLSINAYLNGIEGE